MSRKGGGGIRRRKREEGNDGDIQEDNENNDNIVEGSKFIFRYDVIIVTISSIIVRLILYHSCSDWISNRVELSTPLNAFNRLKEAIQLKKDLNDIYVGDRVHITPLLVTFFPDISQDLIFFIFIIFDLLSAIFFSIGANHFSCERGDTVEKCDQIRTTVFRWCLLNPISIMTCSALSISVIYSLLSSIFTAAFLARKETICALVLSIWTQFSMYPILLIVPLLNRIRQDKVWTLFIFFSSLSILTLCNYILCGNSFKFIEHTYLFTILVEDLTPNVGVFWYFFTEIFTHFHQFFLILFQLNILVYVIPLALTLRNAPFLNLLVSYALICVFVPYPSLSDVTVFITLLPLVEEKHWKGIRYLLIESCTFVTCIVLMPVMWHLWIVSGSGNANFYFGVTLFYNIALIQMAIDIVHSYLKEDLKERCPKDVPPNTLIHYD